MNERRFRKNNKGMSLVELIIVIAIIAVITTVSMVTLSVMHGAKAKDAAMAFESRVSELQAKQRGQIVVCKTSESDPTEVKEKDFRYSLKLYGTDNKAYVMDSIAIVPKPASAADYNDKLIEDKNGDGLGTCLSQYVMVRYTDLDGKSTILADGKDVSKEIFYITFDKSGACVEGAGSYDFIKKSSKSTIATVTINKNGSIQMR